MKRCCLYCGSSRGNDDVFLESAAALGVELARRGIELVYGGASVGLMGMAASRCIEAGGRVTGVITEHLSRMGVARDNITELIVVESMHERKELMVSLSDAFIALPGGIGTLEEILEVLTWAQIGLHEKPSGFLNPAGFYDGLLGFLGHVSSSGFLRKEHLESIVVESAPAAMIDRLEAWRSPGIAKWFDVEKNKI